MKNGRGVTYISNGNRDDGEWKNNIKEGKGTFYYLNGNKYEQIGKIIEKKEKEVFILLMEINMKEI